MRKKQINFYVPEVEIEHYLRTNIKKKTDKWAKLGIDSGSFTTSVGIWGLLRSLMLWVKSH